MRPIILAWIVILMLNNLTETHGLCQCTCSRKNMLPQGWGSTNGQEGIGNDRQFENPTASCTCSCYRNPLLERWERPRDQDVSHNIGKEQIGDREEEGRKVAVYGGGRDHVGGRQEERRTEDLNGGGREQLGSRQEEGRREDLNGGGREQLSGRQNHGPRQGLHMGGREQLGSRQEEGRREDLNGGGQEQLSGRQNHGSRQGLHMGGREQLGSRQEEGRREDLNRGGREQLSGRQNHGSRQGLHMGGREQLGSRLEEGRGEDLNRGGREQLSGRQNHEPRQGLHGSGREQLGSGLDHGQREPLHGGGREHFGSRQEGRREDLNGGGREHLGGGQEPGQRQPLHGSGREQLGDGQNHGPRHEAGPFGMPRRPNERQIRPQGQSKKQPLRKQAVNSRYSGVYYGSTDHDLKWEENWMSALPNETNIWQMSIPGTHNSFATWIRDPVQSGNTANHNSFIDEQLSGGIRYIDIRCGWSGDTPQTQVHTNWTLSDYGVDENDVILHHASIPLIAPGNIGNFATLKQALNYITSFLQANPGEMILMRLKRESIGYQFNEHQYLQDSKKLQAAVAKTLELPNYKKYIWRPGYFGTNQKPRLPTLGHLRGKIVILQTSFKYSVEFGNWLKNELDPKDILTIPDRYRLSCTLVKHLNKFKLDRGDCVLCELGSIPVDDFKIHEINNMLKDGPELTYPEYNISYINQHIYRPHCKYTSSRPFGMYVQDEANEYSFNKLTHVYNTINLAYNDKLTDTLYLNHVSGYIRGIYHSYYAPLVNKPVVKYFNKYGETISRLGVIIMDYELAEEVTLIIDTNFRFLKDNDFSSIKFLTVKLYSYDNHQYDDGYYSKLVTLRQPNHCFPLHVSQVNFYSNIGSIELIGNGCIKLHSNQFCTGESKELRKVSDDYDEGDDEDNECLKDLANCETKEGYYWNTHVKSISQCNYRGTLAEYAKEFDDTIVYRTGWRENTGPTWNTNGVNDKTNM